MDDETAMFLAALERDPWTAIEWPLPDNADVAALEVTRAAAFQCFEMRRAPAGSGLPSPADVEACVTRLAAIDARIRGMLPI